ncbi:MAG: hypothetical protein HY698_09185 [Deltaproteobacteria bacterium]|nr:hypothetical protein [Deltaproteobacteria bacterium]
MRMAVLAGFLIGWLASLPGVPFAVAQGNSLVAVVRVPTESDRDLFARIQGQTSDLDVALLTDHGPLEAGFRAQVLSAQRLAGSRAARVVAWFQRDESGGIVVYVAEPGASRVLVRELRASREAFSSSATAEAAALVVRSALRALAAGGEIGITVPAPPAAEETAGEKPRSAAAELRKAAPIAWQSMVGWQVALDGHSALGQNGLVARLGVARGHLEGSLSATAAFPSSLDDGRTQVNLSRHNVAFGLAYRPWAFGNLRVSIGASVGAAGYSRSTLALEPSVRAAPSRTTVSLLVGPEARIAWAFHPRGASVGIEATLAVDVVVGAPQLGYQVGDEFVTRYRLWPVTPRAGLGLVVRTD